MDRALAIDRVASDPTAWDIVVIGGGASGFGAAVDAAARGYRTLLLEQSDFGKATSSRSTKLIHGGVRYLKQGRIGLVRESLRERGLLLRNAPHLTRRVPFIIPAFRPFETTFYRAGLALYDGLAGKLALGRSRTLTPAQVVQDLPTIEPHGLRGGVRYFDGQFDDARLIISLARTLFDLGGVAINYMPVVALAKANGRVEGLMARDLESGRECAIRARAVINAAGVFVDDLRRLDEKDAPALITISQGSHIVLDQAFLPGGSALMIPKTSDGRVLFAIPWLGHVIVGTTDTPVAAAVLEPRPLGDEIEFILTNAAQYLAKDPTDTDIRSAFAGLRPLVKPRQAKHTSRVSRDHTVAVSDGCLITLTGGKWTTYRKMGEDAVNTAIAVGGLESRAARTANLQLHGWRENTGVSPHARPDAGALDHWTAYGSDESAVRDLALSPGGSERLHPALPYQVGAVIWSARHEMARTVEDVLARRTRALFLNAEAAIQSASAVAALLAGELGRDVPWQEQQVKTFNAVAKRYLHA